MCFIYNCAEYILRDLLYYLLAWCIKILNTINYNIKVGAHENIRICFSFIYHIYVDYYGLFVWATGLQIIRYKAENERLKNRSFMIGFLI